MITQNVLHIRLDSTQILEEKNIENEIAAELVSAKAARIAQSKTDLEAYLAAHPYEWNGKLYNITDQKTGWLTSKVVAATAAAAAGTPYTLKWNETGDVCEEWTLADLTALALAIDARVTALVEYQQAQEIAMNAAATLDELNAIVVDYDSVQ